MNKLNIFGISAIVIILVILAKTGSIGKAFSFFMAYLFFPIIFGLLGGFLLKSLDMSVTLGSVIGFSVGLILAFKKGFKNMK